MKPNQRVRKAVIPAAGLGTRFLPATKAMPKEMLPLVDKPTLQYIIEEAVASGIEEIIIITSSTKSAMENHFDINWELEERLKIKGKLKEAQAMRDIANLANIYYVRQKEPKGLGHAILCAHSFIGDEPFAVLLGDDVVINKDKNATPALKQCIDAFDKLQESVLGVQEVALEDVSKYGIVNPKSAVVQGKPTLLKGVIEKPTIDEAPSNLAILGRYVFTNEIFEYLKDEKVGKGGEIWLTDSILRMLENDNIWALPFSGKRYDIGNKLGFIEATIDLALERPELRDAVEKMLLTKIKK